MKLTLVAVGVVALIFAALTARQLPDLRRYMKIRSM
jgi:hypothetical protein